MEQQKVLKIILIIFLHIFLIGLALFLLYVFRDKLCNYELVKTQTEEDVVGDEDTNQSTNNDSSGVDDISIPVDEDNESNGEQTYRLGYTLPGGERYAYVVSFILPSGAVIDPNFNPEPSEGSSNSRGELRINFENGSSMGIRGPLYTTANNETKIYDFYTGCDGYQLSGTNTQFGNIYRCYMASNIGYSMIEITNNIVLEGTCPAPYTGDDGTIAAPCHSSGLSLNRQDPDNMIKIDSTCFISSNNCGNDLECIKSNGNHQSCDELLSTFRYIEKIQY